MKKIKKVILLSICLLAGLFFIWTAFFWKIFKSNFSGSYPSAETWYFKIKEDSLIKLINQLKKEHPELEPPNVSYPTSGKESYWYKFLFFYANTNEDVQTLLRSNEDSLYTTIYFVALSSHIDSLTPIKDITMNRREINKDFSYFDNRREIKKFENTIIKLIKEKIQR